MIKQFLIKNWLWAIVFGLMAFFYFEKSQESRAKDQIIDEVIENHERDKRELDQTISSITHTVRTLNGEVDSLDARSSEIETELKRIQNERTKVSRTVPTYTDTQLDSILTNHRHR